MKPITRLSLLTLTLILLFHQQSISANEAETKITGSIYTGAIKAPKSEPVKQRPALTVRRTLRQQVSGRTVTIHEVDPPVRSSKLTPKTLPTAPLIETPADKLAEAETQHTRFIFVNAEVYDKGVTRLTVWHNGQQAVCWTKINTRYLQCFDQFKSEGRPYHMIASILAAEHPSQAQKDGCPMASLQRKRKNTPYVLTEANPRDLTATTIIQDLHKIYRVEETRLQTAYSKHLKNTALRVALPLAPAAPPKPVTIRFWKRDVVKERRNEQMEGGKGR